MLRSSERAPPGLARISTDPTLMQRFVHDGKAPLSVILIDVKEAYLHCPKAVHPRWAVGAGRAGRTEVGAMRFGVLLLAVLLGATACARGSSVRPDDEESGGSFENEPQSLSSEAPSPLSAEARIDIAVALIRHLLGSAPTEEIPTPYFVTIDGQDLPEEIAKSLSAPPHRIFPGSKHQEGSGSMLLVIGLFAPQPDGSVQISLHLHCGDQCDSGHTAIVRRSSSGWEVLSTQMIWIS